MTDSQPKPRSSLAVWLVVGLLFLPPTYVLSIGPAIWLFKHGYFGQGAETLEAVYMPLSLAGKYCPPLDSFMEWYVSWWEK